MNVHHDIKELWVDQQELTFEWASIEIDSILSTNWFVTVNQCDQDIGESFPDRNRNYYLEIVLKDGTFLEGWAKMSGKSPFNNKFDYRFEGENDGLKGAY